MAEKRLDTLIIDLLKKNDGVFLGEHHDAPSLQQAVLELLPMLKDHGVGTLSLEFPQHLIDEAVHSKDYNNFKSKWPGGDEKVFRRIYELVHTASKLGMKALGHEIPSKYFEFCRIDPTGRVLSDSEKAEVFDSYDNLLTEEAVNSRNSFAARHIKEHRRGKAVVIGGVMHSGNYNSSDRPGIHMIPIYKLFSNSSFEGMKVVNRYQGLDVKLGYPSIDHRRDSFGVNIGFAKESDRKFNDYEVFLPENLGQLRITSLPTGKQKSESACKMSE
jgi:hypothetical protein